MEQKLLFAIQRWEQKLGARFLPDLERMPKLLTLAPITHCMKLHYLASIGIASPKSIWKRNPNAFEQSLTSMQTKVALLQDSVQTLSFVKKHPDTLRCRAHLSMFKSCSGCLKTGLVVLTWME